MQVKISGKDDFARKKVRFVRESIVTDGVRTSVWLGAPQKHVEGFEWSVRPGQKPFYLVERRAAEGFTLVQPSDEFIPDFMLRGNIPRSLAGALQFFLEEDKDQVKGSESKPGYFRIDLPDNTLEFKQIDQMWVPWNLESEDTKLHWKWESVSGQAVPTFLEVEEPLLERYASYIVTNSIINSEVDPARFVPESFDVRDGDRLADHVNQQLLVFRDGKFVDFKLADERKFPFAFLGSGILIAVFFAGILLWKHKNTRTRRSI